jgi:hypothetical protein
MMCDISMPRSGEHPEKGYLRHWTALLPATKLTYDYLWERSAMMRVLCALTPTEVAALDIVHVVRAFYEPSYRNCIGTTEVRSGVHARAWCLA